MKIRDTGIRVGVPGKNRRRKGFSGSADDWTQESKGRGLSKPPCPESRAAQHRAMNFSPR